MNPRDLHISSNGDVEFATPTKIMAVGIENIGDLLSHEITREAGATAHVIRYLNGGIFRFLYTSDGAIKDLSGEHIGCTITHDDKIIIRRLPEPLKP